MQVNIFASFQYTLITKLQASHWLIFYKLIHHANKTVIVFHKTLQKMSSFSSKLNFPPSLTDSPTILMRSSKVYQDIPRALETTPQPKLRRNVAPVNSMNRYLHDNKSQTLPRRNGRRQTTVPKYQSSFLILC